MLVINKGNQRKMEVTLQSIGWRSKVTQKRATLSISINKLVAVGCGLKKGQTLYCYLAEDKDKRPVMILYLDGKRGDDVNSQKNRQIYK